MTRRDVIRGAAALAAAKALAQAAPPFTLPPLPYAASALEPYIDTQTMEIHHDKHHKAYVDNLNKAVAAHPELANRKLDQLLRDLPNVPEPIRVAVRNNGGGHWNHSLFWQTLGKPKEGPSGKLAAAVDKSFGSREAFEGKLQAAGLTVFGSGWVWVMPQGGGLAIETSPNQDTPIMSGREPLFGIDVWEHAYYLKYQNRRAEYLSAAMHVLNWDFLSQRYSGMAG
ncbi:MAG TPA: superoxide dismutase [Bryobacteraceae bacterium]|nr:superoxide dismutase [Bryobacteraceae bacterium]